MKLISVLLLVILITAPALGNQNATYTEEDLLRALHTGFNAGIRFSTATYTKSFYDIGVGYYGTVITTVTDTNIAIREYNSFLEENFNSTIVNKLMLTEFSL